MFSTKQIIVISQAVEKAYRHQKGKNALGLPGDLDGSSESARKDFWRRRELAAAVGKTSYKDCHKMNDFLPVLERFQMLAGQTAVAFGTAMNQEANQSGRGIWIAKISELANQAKFHPSYIEAISQGKFRTKNWVSGLDAHQLKNLFFTLNNRAAAKRDKAESGEKTDPNSQRRNKSQRCPKKASAAAEGAFRLEEMEFPF